MERHPKLRAAFLEGTAGWLPWWLWRLDDQWEKFGPAASGACRCCRANTSSGSATSRSMLTGAGDPRGQRHGRRVLRRVKRLPASGRSLPEGAAAFFGMALTDEQRKKILWDNCARLYAIPTPAARLLARSRRYPQPSNREAGPRFAVPPSRCPISVDRRPTKGGMAVRKYWHAGETGMRNAMRIRGLRRSDRSSSPRRLRRA